MLGEPYCSGAWLLAAFLAVLVLLPIYRSVFSGLPLSVDTGFYVPNQVVATGRFAPFRGWNIQYSGASRALPQWIHSWAYLRFGSGQYAWSFRWLYTALTVVSGVLASFLMVILGYQGWIPACTLLLYVLLASESQYGSYFESAEIFETVIQLTGLLLLVYGAEVGSIGWAGLGLILFWIDAVFIKLSGAATAGLVSLVALIQRPDWWPLIVGLGAGAVGLYLYWLRLCGVTLQSTLRHLAQHERHCRFNYRSPWRLYAVKIGFAGLLVIRNPFIPLLAAIGMFHPSVFKQPVGVSVYLAAYVIGWAVAYFKQSNRVHYYFLPVLPIVAMLAALGVDNASRVIGLNGALAMVVAMCLLSVFVNLRQWAGRSLRHFNQKIWSFYNRKGARIGEQLADGNFRLMQAVPELRKHLVSRSMLVVGRHNQASVLLDAGYDTPLTSLCELSEGVVGDLRPWLPDIENNPPDFLLDTDKQYEKYAAVIPVLKRYQLVVTAEGQRLYRLHAAAAGSRMSTDRDA